MVLLMEFILAKGTNEGKSFYVWKHSTSIDYLVLLSLP